MKSLYSNPSKYSEKIKLQFSPDGKYLGISNESKLFLYSTVDWALIHTFNYGNGYKFFETFAFSNDNNTLYIGGFGLYKIDLISKQIKYTYSRPIEASVITESPNMEKLLCYSNSYLILLDNTVTSIPETKEIDNIFISPNPVQESLNLTISTEIAQLLICSISNIEGNIVLSNMKKELTSGMNQLVINVNELASGVYFFNATIDGHSKSYKFVVEK